MHFLFIFCIFCLFLLIFYSFCALFVHFSHIFYTHFFSSFHPHSLPLSLPSLPFSSVLTDNYDLLFAKDRHGQTHLQRAAATGDVIRVTSLIEQGAEVNVVDHAGWTPLHEAALEGHMEVVKCLVEV